MKDNKVAYNWSTFRKEVNIKLIIHLPLLQIKKIKSWGLSQLTAKHRTALTRDKKVNAPMDLIAMVDESPSYSSFSSSIFPILKKMMADANPKSRMAFYGTSVNTYNNHRITKGEATRWLSMEEANKFIDIVINKMEKTEREGWSNKYASNWFLDAIKKPSNSQLKKIHITKKLNKHTRPPK